MPRTTSPLIKLAVCLAIAVQGSFGAAAGKTAGPAISGLVCSPSGIVSAEAQQAVENFLGALDSDREDGAAGPHCPLCVGVDLSVVEGLALRFLKNGLEEALPASIAVGRHLRPLAQGPPSGSRAPPSTV
ncbi:MAG: DUF2946 family protein [Pseudomonadota bacterium]